MYMVEISKDFPRYFMTYSEAKRFVKSMGWSTRRIKDGTNNK